MSATILIVEDETQVAMQLSRHIVSMGHRVVGPVGSIHEAVALADAQGGYIDLALLDICLGHNDAAGGDSCAAELALQLRARHAIPSVFLTAYSDSGALRRAKPCEPLGYLCKPIDERALWATVRAALHTHETTKRGAQAERARHQSDARGRAILDHLPEAVLALDGDQRIALYNQAAAALFGYAPAEALGQSVTLLLPQGLAASHDQTTACDRALRDPSPARRPTLEVLARRRDASEFAAEISLTSAQLGDELIQIAVVRDRRARYTQEPRDAQAERFEALGRLAGGIAHDFNNLLTAILGYARLLRSSFEPCDPRRRDIGEIEAAGERAVRLVRELLSCSGKHRSKREPVTINGLITGIQGLLKASLGGKVELRLGLTPDLPMVTTDAGRLERVFVNLIANARDASHDDSTVFVETRVASHDERRALRDLSPDQGAVVISVRDTGIGMDHATQRRIFEPFFTTKQHSGGTGLGLATAYGIVRQNGGEILVDSAPGRGTSIHVVLPASERIGRALQACTRQASSTSMRTATLLLVEDEPRVRDITARMLRDAGHRVLVASDAAEASQMIEALASDLDLLLGDVSVLEGDGRSLAERFRSRFPNKPVLLMSGLTPRLLGQPRDPTNATLIDKPVAPDVLQQLVGDLLAGGPSRARQLIEVAG